MQLFTRASLTLRIKKFLKQVIAFNWFPVELQILLMCRSKLSLSSISILSKSTEGTAFILCFSIWTTSFAWSCFYLSIKRIWNLSALTIILCSLNHLMVFKDCDSKIWRRPSIVLEKADKVLSSAKLNIEAFSIM